MKKEDYFKYYIQGSDNYLIPSGVFDELFNEMSYWREESKQLKEKVNKFNIDKINHDNKSLKGNCKALGEKCNNQKKELQRLIEKINKELDCRE